MSPGTFPTTCAKNPIDQKILESAYPVVVLTGIVTRGVDAATPFKYGGKKTLEVTGSANDVICNPRQENRKYSDLEIYVPKFC